MISKQAKYALRALIGLARAEPVRAVLTADLATQQRIPKKFLEQSLLLSSAPEWCRAVAARLAATF